MCYKTLTIALASLVLATNVFAQEETLTPTPSPTPQPTPTKIERLCPKVIRLKPPILWKAKASSHITGGPLSISTTLIFGSRWRVAPPTDCIKGYNRFGKLIHKLGEYARNESAYRARYYGGAGCGDVKPAKVVQKLAKKGPLYLKISKRKCLRMSNKGINQRTGGL